MRCTCSRCPTLAAVSISLVLGACGGRETTAPETMPIHLEDRLASAQIEGAEVDAETAKPIAWHFGEGPAGWKVLPSRVEGATPAEVDVATEGLRVSLKKTSFAPEKNEGLDGGVYIDVDALNIDLWSHVLIEARASAETTWIGIGYNLNESPGVEPEDQWPTAFWGSGTRLVGDGRVQTYRIPVRGEGGPITEPVRQVVIEFGAKGPAEIELLSVSLVPALATYAESGVGVRSVSSMNHQAFGPQRRTLYSHVPSRIAFPLRVPGHGRLDLALGTFGGETRLKVAIDSGSSTEVLLDESVPPLEAWRQRSLDLEKWSGQEIELVLQSEADSPGALAFWASPTVSSAKAERSSERPNVVFYVIDGASAGYMSVYGYERPTTPNLQQLAAEGVVFDRAYSNATWTMPSTASFMTSLYHSVLGGLRDDANPVPPRVPTMAEHFHDAGFHTGVFTFNPNAGALSGLDRAVDVFRDYGKRSDPFDPIEAISSQVLQGQFWEWRNAYPGPYWVHFQTTDVHPPYHPQEPFAGRYSPPEQTDALEEQFRELRFPFNHTSASVHEHWQKQLAEHDVDPRSFYRTMQNVHDEAMLHQDHQIGELVKELKARGEWENTLLIIASDHGHPAASYPRFGRGLLDPQPAAWEGALFGEFESHIPLIFVWPGHIEGGRRIEAPVSMIDMLPTVLDLAGLPAAKVAQGQSLAPLLLDKDGWEPRPVVFDEFRVTDDGTLIGNLEIVDGRWGDSLEIRERELEAGEPGTMGRHPAPAGGRWKALAFADVPRLLTYDLDADPRAIHHVVDADLARRTESERQLWRLWREHRALSATFEAGEAADLSSEQIEALRALGYIE